jgi:hypothetical protein
VQLDVNVVSITWKTTTLFVDSKAETVVHAQKRSTHDNRIIDSTSSSSSSSSSNIDSGNVYSVDCCYTPPTGTLVIVQKPEVVAMAKRPVSVKACATATMIACRHRNAGNAVTMNRYRAAMGSARMRPVIVTRQLRHRHLKLQWHHPFRYQLHHRYRLPVASSLV